MSTAFYHRHDHAVIVFADTLQWTPALELVDTLDTLVELYFYALVELVVSSPGGEVRALRYVLDAMEAHRAQGVRIRTRVLSHAESAAAVLVCLGDERIASQTHGCCSTQAARWTSPPSPQAAPRRFGTGSRAPTMRSSPCWSSVRCEASTPSGRSRPNLSTAQHSASSPPRSRKTPPPRTRPRARRPRHPCGRVRRPRSAHPPLPPPPSNRARRASPSSGSDHVGRRAPERPGSEEPTGLAIPEWRVLYPPEGDARLAHPPHPHPRRDRRGQNRLGHPPRRRRHGPRTARAPVRRAHHRPQTRTRTRAPIPGPTAPAPPPCRHRRARPHGRTPPRAPRRPRRPALRQRRDQDARPHRLLRPLQPRAHPLRHHGPRRRRRVLRQGGRRPCALRPRPVLILTAPDAPAPETWLARDGEARAWAEALRRRARGTDSERGPNALALTAWALDSVLRAGITVWPSDDGAPSGWLSPASPAPPSKPSATPAARPTTCSSASSPTGCR